MSGEQWGNGGVVNANSSRASRRNLGDPIGLDTAHREAMRIGSDNLLRALDRFHSARRRALTWQRP